MAARDVSRRRGAGAARSRPTGMEPLSPRRKWRAITVATLVLVPGFWSMMAGLVALATDDDQAAEPAGLNSAAAVAFGLAIIPFVFIVLAFLSEHPNAPGAVLRAMGLSLLVGLLATAFTGDPVTGVVAGVGSGGVCALRMDVDHSVRDRVVAVLVAAVYTFVLVRMVGGVALLPAPIFPFTALGVADHLSERRAEREASPG
ncbi:MAG TPA: hypothetical protein VFI47_30640 [Acidimicrobiales bacterium]|nr:hypothetical protein [Acidimicrobiales bacterium]